MGASNIMIRPYGDSDARAVGILIADTFSEFNLAPLAPDQRDLFLGPFLHARSPDKDHQVAIARAIRSEMVFVAERQGEILGVLRGRTTRLGSLFVRGDQHRRGIGRGLVTRFEQECARQGGGAIKVAATLYAVPFYLEMGYRRTTGVRAYRGFGGTGLVYQPMKKVLKRKQLTGEEVTG
ncbi:MAG: GNAT family N-acetyltransferase [Anaerolineae bacterium]|nr:GNAT family N-acetyltransferase [Anaerolineae bacterium]